MNMISLGVMLIISFSAHAEQDDTCNSSPVFAFSQALYWQEYQRAIRLLPRIERERSTVMATFLAQVLKWKQGYDKQNSKQQIQALDSIDKQISRIETTLPYTALPEFELNAGNIMLHSARLNLVMSRVIRAARLAKRGNFLITKVLRQNPGEVDALLAAGLYQYYAGNDQNGFAWAKRWFAMQGDEKRGRQLIEQAMVLSPDFAFEAARSLKMELDWNKQDVCRYPGLLPSPLAFSLHSIEVTQLEITTDLFCGRTQLANQRLREIEPQLGAAQAALVRWFEDARLFALAQAGEVEKLSAMHEALQAPQDSPIRIRVQLSLAKALDVKGRHDQAKPLYQVLTESTVEDDYTSLAKHYFKQPYRVPVKIMPDQNLVACVEN